MMAKKKNLEALSILVFVITLMSGRAEAFINFDVKRVGTAVMNGVQQGLQIKSEIDSNLAMVKDIQNRGFAATAQDLFGRIQNGEYDRFGDMLTGLKENAMDATQSAQEVKARKDREEADREAKMEAMLRAEEAARKAAEPGSAEAHAQMKAKQSIWKNAYNWVKNHKSATDAGFGTLDSIKNGDVANAVRNAAGGAGNVVGGEAGQGLGALGGIVGAGTDIINNSDNLGDIITNTANNGELSGSLGSLPTGSAKGIDETLNKYEEMTPEKFAKKKSEVDALKRQLTDSMNAGDATDEQIAAAQRALERLAAIEAQKNQAGRQ